MIAPVSPYTPVAQPVVQGKRPPRSWKPLKPVAAIPAVAATVFIMAYSGLFSPYSILAFYALWLPLVFLKGGSLIMPPKGSGLVMAYLALATLSCVWSFYRGVSLRAAVEFGSMVACSFVIMRVVPNKTYLKGLIAGIAVVLMASIASGNYGVDPFSGNYALVGLFGSKNQIGFFAELGIYLSILMWFSGERRLTRLLYTPSPLLISLYCLYVSHSATSVASLVATLMVVVGVYFLTRLPKRMRRLSFTVAILFGLIFLALGATLGMQDLILHILGKNSTLTGRTYLWAKGYEYGMRDPLIGVGYAGFWVPGRLEAEHLWYEFGITGKSGFHFHNTFVETFVELGIPGLFIVLSWLISSLMRSIGTIIRFGNVLEGLLPLGICLILFVRAFAEVDILQPFNMGTFLLIPILPSLLLYNRGGQFSND